jgi:hypothetical protein
MSDVTQILSAIEQGDPQAAEQLLPLPAFQLPGPFLRHYCHRPDALRLASERIGSPGSSTMNVLDTCPLAPRAPLFSENSAKISIFFDCFFLGLED